MGIVFKQSLNNTIITYIGFGIGAINTLFLYTSLLTDEYYGLVGVILSAAVVLMPIMAFGVQNTLVKYYSSFKSSTHLDGFLSLMLFLPLFVILPLFVFCWIWGDQIGDFLAVKNPIVKDYIWYIFIIGLALAYFEIFYAWVKVHLKSVFGNFMKEIFVRAGVMLLLILIYLDLISVHFFLKALVGLQLVRVLIMKLYAFRLRMPKISFQWPENTRSIINYTALIVLGGSVAVVLLEIDKVMLNQFIAIENVAYYGVATYIAMVINVPSRSMHQITYPLTAKLINENDHNELKTLYQKSSLTLFIVSGLLFILIVLNVNDLFLLLPQSYRNGFVVVFMLGLVKVYDSLLGNNNAILYNSDYYRAILFMGVLLAILTIVFNLWLIPKYGINGAAIASFLAFFIYNTIKLIYVKVKFHMLPFSMSTLTVLLLFVAIATPVYFIELGWYPLVNIVLRSLPIILVFSFAIYRLKVSKDINGIIDKFFKKR